MAIRFSVQWYGAAKHSGDCMERGCPGCKGEDMDPDSCPSYSRCFPTEALAMAFAKKIAGSEAYWGCADVQKERTASLDEAREDGEAYHQGGKWWTPIGPRQEVMG